jgi:hypothetical protein
LFAIDQKLLQELAAGRAKLEAARELRYVRAPLLGPYWNRAIDYVVAKVLVNTNGEAIDARVSSETPVADPVTRAAVMDFVKGVKYAPATINGEPISVWVDHELDMFGAR